MFAYNSGAMSFFNRFSFLTKTRTIRLVVPPEFNRNSPNVVKLMTPEDSGIWLLDRMRQQVGFENYSDTKLLDFGCGVRFSQALINTNFSIGQYVGVDVCRPMIKFLQKNVRNNRFSYHFVDAYHPNYNPGGSPLTHESRLPLTQTDFNLVCLFSVITHQSPEDSAIIFSLLRRHVRSDGHLFFTCFLDDSISEYEDRSADQNRGRCFYNSGFLTELVQTTGWRLIAKAPPNGPLIGDSFVFAAQ